MSARRPHRHRERSTCDPDLQWFLDDDDVLARRRGPALDAHDPVMRRDPTHQVIPAPAASSRTMIDFDVGVFEVVAVLSRGTSTFVSGKYAAAHPRATG